jgi:multiple sugar transport system ATP-binding protein
MTVYENVAFGLRMQKLGRDTIDRRVRSSAGLLHIENLLDRYPSQVSGGQRQRIAVARAIAMESEVLLMDEPLSNLDALLRLEMRAELKRLLSEIGSTTVYVTHDQVEAMSMGDRIAVMRSGKILQLGKPLEIYHAPVDRFVGGFIGNPPMNFVTGTIGATAGRLEARLDGAGTFSVDDAHRERLGAFVDRMVTIGIRAESIEVVDASAPSGDELRARVVVVEPLGSHDLLTVTLADQLVKVQTRPNVGVRPDDDIRLRFEPDRAVWLDPESGRTVAA